MVSIVYCNKRYRSINRLQLQNLGIKPKTIGTLKKQFERNYHESIKASVQPKKYLDYSAYNQQLEEEQNDELDVVFINDKEDQ